MSKTGHTTRNTGHTGPTRPHGKQAGEPQRAGPNRPKPARPLASTSTPFRFRLAHTTSTPTPTRNPHHRHHLCVGHTCSAPSPRRSTPGLRTPVPIHRLTRGFGLCSPGHPPVRTTHRPASCPTGVRRPASAPLRDTNCVEQGRAADEWWVGLGWCDWCDWLAWCGWLVGCVWLVLLRRVWPCGVWVFGVSQIGGLTVPDWSCIVHVDSELTAEERKAERRLQARHLRPTGADRSPVRGGGGEPLRQPRRMRGPVSADQILLRRVQGPPWWWTCWTTEACPARP